MKQEKYLMKHSLDLFILDFEKHKTARLDIASRSVLKNISQLGIRVEM